MKIEVKGSEISTKELLWYQEHGQEKFGTALDSMEITILDDDTAEVKYNLVGQPFERIRRITGYLVGTLDRFNNAKRAEEHDRVKHDTCRAASDRKSA